MQMTGERRIESSIVVMAIASTDVGDINRWNWMAGKGTR